jgi:membrane-associated phospholipid phosphatase
MLEFLEGEFGLQIVSFFQTGLVGEVLWYLLLPFHYFGSEKGYLLMIPPIYWAINKSLGKRLLVMLMLGTIVSGLFKILGECPRPFHVNEDLIRNIAFTKEFGLPSGHTVFGTIFGLTLYRYFKQNWQRASCVLFVFVMGISRIVHGMHYLQDVVAGWGIGILIIYLVYVYENQLSQYITTLRLQSKVIGFSFVFLLVITGLGLFPMNSTLISSLGGLTGGMIGLWLEEERLKFRIVTHLQVNSINTLLGLFLLVASYLILSATVWMLQSDMIGKWISVLYLLKYILLGFMVAYGIPYMIYKSKMQRVSYCGETI